MNKVVERIKEIVELLPEDDYYWEIKVICPECRRYTMLLKAGGVKGPHYYCLNCGIEGSIDKLYYRLLAEIIERPRGVKI